jgi:hypothetical protein
MAGGHRPSGYSIIGHWNGMAAGRYTGRGYGVPDVLALFAPSAFYDTGTIFNGRGGLYITGAIGVEAVGERYLLHNGGTNTLTYQMVIVVEEGLEMVGIVVFLYAIMTYMAAHQISLLVAFTSGQSSVEPLGSSGGMVPLPVPESLTTVKSQEPFPS